MAFGGENFTPLLSMESYLEFVILMILPFGVMFNLPLLMMVLALAGLVKEKTLKRGRKFVILAAFILAAVITPTPDILTQSLLALPAVFFYEISLHVIGIMEKAHHRKESGYSVFSDFPGLPLQGSFLCGKGIIMTYI